MNDCRALLLVPVFVAGLTLASAVRAQPEQREQAGIAFTGEVEDVDTVTNTLKVRGANGEHGIFAIDPVKTTIMSGSQTVGLADLQLGDWVSIDADAGDEQKTATYVEVVDQPDDSRGPGKAESSPGGVAIEVGHDKLAPGLVQIGPGESVTFRNVDEKPGVRTVMATDGSFSSPGLAKGESWSHSFDVPGVYPVRLKENPAATAKIVVE